MIHQYITYLLIIQGVQGALEYPLFSRSQDTTLNKALHPYIINGEKASSGQFPFVAYLLGKNHACTGSVISRRHILTAAHCHSADKPITEVLVGTTDIRQRNKGESIEVSKVIIHPFYSSSSINVLRNDLAIIILQREISHSDVKAIILSAHDRSDEQVPNVATLAGFGITDPKDSSSASPHLLHTSMQLITLKECINATLNKILSMNSKSRENINTDHFGLGKEHVCTISNTSQSACFGDSGGPLIIQKSGVRILIGATSGGLECGSPNTPNIFSSVANGRKFIDTHSQGHRWHKTIPRNDDDSFFNHSKLENTSCKKCILLPQLLLLCAFLVSQWLL